LVELWVTAVATLASSTSRAKVDLPDPLTPVTATRRLSGIAAVTSLRLCRFARSTVSQCSLSGSEVVAGSSCFFLRVDFLAAGREAAAASSCCEQKSSAAAPSRPCGAVLSA